MDFVVVFITVGSTEEGEQLARALVEEKLAACVNRIAGVQSTYRWQGQVVTDQEQLLVVKTSAAMFDQLEQRVRELHSYDVPEIVTVPIVRGSAAYLNWLSDALAAPDDETTRD